jgi:hypothetical protein
MKNNIFDNLTLIPIVIAFLLIFCLESCVLDEKENDNEYLIILDSNYLIGFTQYERGLCVSYPEMKYCLNQKFRDLYASALFEVKNKKKWHFERLWFEYPQRDSIYLEEFISVVNQETKKIYPERDVLISKNDGTVYITINP